ncbi:sigma-70 family RNA polymerase sigma factor [Dyadobacter chenwenxiniae]|uniref:Sigma-70 family RNA polymerase sigma factor n=1 Tax=Dyadobacter chenwenxiniae TaxID=2906456 RepID=A0A9X1PPU7_9BACT|nr:sigma-70 family RNA polymerase sigma factor [Dyadobacter chenwenxiniae]MCF0050567.1 sigma-70 family RNA polymerase sigma factor [Dyadobacter chenwenxiniae]MCF0065190.1 sigma-70 family RNA polymerase sigma factor [Dyadobacter chenwenxiniae]UON84541.1 sigma-70 family RNA polymerase sigma factor [Dyadobacter chenwenxiniae]
MNLLKDGDDRNAFNELYVRYWKVIYDIGFKKLHNASLAEDLVHDLFVDIWNKRQEITIHSTFIGYLHTMLTNRLIDQNRKEVFRLRVQQSLLDRTAASENQFFDAVACNDIEKQLMAEVENLPADMRKIFLLSRQEHLSTSEIAQKLSLSPQTVKNQISNAIRRLRLKELHL